MAKEQKATKKGLNMNKFAQKFGSVNKQNIKLKDRSQRTRTGAYRGRSVKAH